MIACQIAWNGIKARRAAFGARLLRKKLYGLNGADVDRSHGLIGHLALANAILERLRHADYPWRAATFIGICSVSVYIRLGCRQRKVNACVWPADRTLQSKRGIDRTIHGLSICRSF